MLLSSLLILLGCLPMLLSCLLILLGCLPMLLSCLLMLLGCLPMLLSCLLMLLSCLLTLLSCLLTLLSCLLMLLLSCLLLLSLFRKSEHGERADLRTECSGKGILFWCARACDNYYRNLRGRKQSRPRCIIPLHANAS